MEQSVQSRLFDRIKEKLDPKLSLVNEVAEALSVSNDSAYRRIRGETACTIDEAFQLAAYFRIGWEEFSIIKNDTVLFGRSTFRDRADDFSVYLKKTEEYFLRISEAKEKKGYYAAKDIPVFYFFQFEELARFKLFFWLNTMKGNQKLEAKKFSFEIIPQEFVKKAKDISNIYFRIPFAEIWNDETVNAVLKQVQYFHESGWFADDTVPLLLYEKIEELIHLIQRQAETGLKWFNSEPVRPETSYELYYDDLVALDNSIYVVTDKFKMAMVSYNAMDYLFTFHAGFCQETEQFLQNQMSKSLILSGASERERNKFFNRIYERIKVLKQKLQ